LFLVRHGLRNSEIAYELGVSIACVKFHVSEILSRLGVSTRSEAAEWQHQQKPYEEMTEVTFQRISPMIRTKDFETTLEFYTDQLGCCTK